SPNALRRHRYNHLFISDRKVKILVYNPLTAQRGGASSLSPPSVFGILVVSFTVPLLRAGRDHRWRPVECFISDRCFPVALILSLPLSAEPIKFLPPPFHRRLTQVLGPH